MLVEAATPSDYAWLADRVSCALTSDFRAIKAVDASGRIHGMVGYCLWSPNAVWVHLALDTPSALRALLEPAFAYPWSHGRNILLATVCGANGRSLRLCRRLGFTEAHRIKDGIAPGEDIVLLEHRKAA